MKTKKHVRKSERVIVYIDQNLAKRFKENPHDAVISTYLSKFIEEKDGPSQMSIMKQVTAAAKKVEAQTEELSLCIQVLVNIYLNMNVRSPMKRALVSCLQGFHAIFKEEIKGFLKEQIHSMLQESCVDSTLKQKRAHVDMLHTLGENFPIGEQCLFEVYVEALNFLSNTMKQLHQETKMNKSPIEKTERMHDIIITVQAFTKIGQKCLKGISSELHNGSNKASLLASIEMIYRTVIAILSDDSFLLDSRITCGIAVSVIIKLCHHAQCVPLIIKLISPSFTTSLLFENNQAKVLLEDDTKWLLDGFSDTLGKNNLPLSSYGCLCHGVLAVITEEELLTVLSEEECLLVDVLFKEIESFWERMSDTTMKIISSRALLLWTSRACSVLASLPVNMQRQFEGNGYISDALLQYVWTHWEDPIDAVKHQSKVIFENCIKLHLLATKEDPRRSSFLVALAVKLLHSSRHLKGKYASLSCLVEYIGTKSLLEVEPTLCQYLLEVLSEQAMASHASELLEKLFIDHQMELDSAENVQEVENMWLNTWAKPILDSLCRGDKQQKIQIIEYVLPRLLKAEPKCVQYVITTLTEQKHIGDNSSQLGALMTCLKRAKSIGIIKTKADQLEKWNGVVPVSLLRSALCHLDEQVRLDTFGLLCENPKTTEVISITDFDLVKFFLSYNMNSQSPAFRQTMMAFIKRFLYRMKEGGQVLKRNSTCQNQGVSPEKNTLESYQRFLMWILDHIFSCLHPGSAFARRTTALGILTILTEMFSDQQKDFFGPIPLLNGERVQTLLECLVDTFEDNKISAFNVLTSLTSQQMGMQDQEKVVELLVSCLHLVSSTKPQDCTTAAYLMKLVLRQDGVHETLVQYSRTFSDIAHAGKQSQNSEQNTAIFDESLLEINEVSEQKEDKLKEIADYVITVPEKEKAFRLWLKILLINLSSQIETARRNLLHAAATRPLYPVLHCIRYLLTDIDLRSLASVKQWQMLIAELLDLCFKVSDIVFPVVSNSSPEGNIPDDEEIISSGLTEENREKDGQFDEDVNRSSSTVKLMPEYLVVCCWRSVKEVSLLLGQLTQTAPCIDSEKEATGGPPDEIENAKGLLSFQQIHAIGEYFKKQLLESVHRGAFELAYAGFIKMCETLWRSTVGDLHQLPSCWLQDIMKDIQDETGSKLCATRRSAGVPFYVQAVVTTEPASTGRRCLIQSMELLLELALPSLEADHEKVSQVHSLNILRALFRDSRLGEAVSPYVADGLRAGISGFNSPNWAVRNASTLLFSAMMTRIFGVKRSKEDMSKKNCMTGRVFFHRYPSLFQFLLEGLDEATKNISDQGQLHLHPALYPILMVLGRLFPALVEGSDPSLNLPAYIPFVIRCAGSPVYKTRIMAARALRPLVFKDQLGTVLGQLTEHLPTDPHLKHSQNLTHGILLQVVHLLKELNDLPADVVQEALDITLDRIVAAKWLICRENKCTVTRAAYLNVAHALLQSCQRVDMDKLDILVDILVDTLCIELSDQDSSVPVAPGYTDFYVAMANMCFDCDQVWCKLKDLLNIDDGSLVAFLLEFPYYEIRLLVLQHLSVLLSTQTCKISRLKDSQKLFEQLVAMGTGLEEHKACMAEVFMVLVHHPLAKMFPWKLSTRIWLPSDVLSLLNSVIKSSSRDDVKSSACRLLGVILPLLYRQLGEGQSEDMYVVLESLSILKMCCDTEQNVSLREACAVTLARPDMSAMFSDENQILGQHVLYLWEAVIELLQDEDILVKDIIARVVDHMDILEEEPGSTYQCLQPSVAIDICMKNLIKLHHSTQPAGCFNLLASMLLDDHEENEETEDRVFDKGEMNTYQEDVTFARLVSKHLQALLLLLSRRGEIDNANPMSVTYIQTEEIENDHLSVKATALSISTDLIRLDQNMEEGEAISNNEKSKKIMKHFAAEGDDESLKSSFVVEEIRYPSDNFEVLSLGATQLVSDHDDNHFPDQAQDDVTPDSRTKELAVKQLISELYGGESTPSISINEKDEQANNCLVKSIDHEQTPHKPVEKSTGPEPVNKFETVLLETRGNLLKYLQVKVDLEFVNAHSQPFINTQKYQTELISLYKHLLAARCLVLHEDDRMVPSIKEIIGLLKNKFSSSIGMNCLLKEAFE